MRLCATLPPSGRNVLERLRGLFGLCLLLAAGCGAPIAQVPRELPDAADGRVTVTANFADPVPAAAPVARPGLLNDWVSPQAVLILSGEEHGYMEPCGCTGGQLGGFAKRAELFRQLREEKKWPTAAFSVGGSLNERRATYPQSKIKYHWMLQGLNQMGYRGAGLGTEELLLKPEGIFNEHSLSANTEGYDLPFLASNVTFFTSKDLGTPGDFRVITVGGVKIGITAVTGLSVKEDLKNNGLLLPEVELKLQDPLEVLPVVLRKLSAERPDVLVLLAYAKLEEAKQIIAKFPQFDVAAVADPLALSAARVGNTLLVPIAEKGNHVEAVGVFRNGNSRRIDHKRVELRENQFPDHPSMAKLMGNYQADLKSQWKDLVAQFVSDPAQGAFVGVESCKDCHKAAYDVWKDSGHAKRSYISLIEGRHDFKGEWTPRIYDPECLACHVTGWQPQTAIRFKSGFVDVASTPHLNNQQCENCHGAGSQHVDLEKAWKPGSPVTAALQEARNNMKLPLARAKQETCIKCHDGDNSPTFEFDSWWAQIEH